MSFLWAGFEHTTLHKRANYWHLELSFCHILSPWRLNRETTKYTFFFQRQQYRHYASDHTGMQTPDAIRNSWAALFKDLRTEGGGSRNNVGKQNCTSFPSEAVTGQISPLSSWVDSSVKNLIIVIALREPYVCNNNVADGSASCWRRETSSVKKISEAATWWPIASSVFIYLWTQSVASTSSPTQTPRPNDWFAFMVPHLFKDGFITASWPKKTKT